MLQRALSLALISFGSFAFLVASAPPPRPSQPIQFRHKVHLEYFQPPGHSRHRESMVSKHEEVFEEYQDGRHSGAMVLVHKELLLKDLEDEDIVAELIKEQIEPGYCNQCHRDFDQNARDLAKLLDCAECHRRKEAEDREFAARMIEDVETGHCTLCHGHFDRNTGENVSRLGACAHCHQYFSDSEWGWERQELTRMRPCIGCHNAILEHPRASIPNTDNCVACHASPLGDDPEETKLVEFIDRKRKVSWERVYDYMPGEIVFSHERHVALGGVECQKCHGDVERADRTLSLQVELRMEDCMDCHQASGASNDCAACHR